MSIIYLFNESNSAMELKLQVASWFTDSDVDMEFIYNIYTV